MIQLYQFAPAWGMPSGSPFCAKLHAYFRMAGVDFEPVNIGDPRKAPKGKVPYIVDDGKTIADSGDIVDHIEATRSPGLLPNDGAEGWQAHALIRLIEEDLYWAIMHARWIVPGVWPTVRADLFAHVPGPMRGFVSFLVRRAVTAQLKGQGMGRHSEAEAARRGAADLRCLADALGERPFYGGESPNAVDASAYAFVGSLLKQPFGGPLKTAAETHASLVAYCGRMDERLFAG